MASKILWNWQQKDWPHFTYDLGNMTDLEATFLKKAGEAFGIVKHLSSRDKRDIAIQMLSNEALQTSEIEGEMLDRESLQSSIKKHFGLQITSRSQSLAENGIADMMMDLYHHYQAPLTHEILWTWHTMLMGGRHDLSNVGCYRTHTEPMQIVSGYIHKPIIHFEAPPSRDLKEEMDHFIEWFNKTAPEGDAPLSILLRCSIAHLYFESIHPFEDGNGRIGRALVEKILAQHLKYPTLIALSQTINNGRKAYYNALGEQSKSNHINKWINYFSNVILNAQKYTIDQLDFIIKKTKFFDKFSDQMNDRQHKVILRIMNEGIKGFEGGLSAKNYMAIAQTSASTATRDLQELVERKILVQTGTLKGTRYWLNMS
jgi:Fic family protein